MTKLKTFFIFLSSCILIIGCAAAGRMNHEKKTVSTYDGVRTVAVSTFASSDPLVAGNIRNEIINSLLGQYSVVIGQSADVVIRGDIALSSDKSISAIHAQIMRNGNIVNSITVKGQETGKSASHSHTAMGREIGTRIGNILSGK